MASTRRTPTWAKPKVRSCTWTPSVLMDGEAALIPTPGTVSPARQAWRVNHPSRYRSPFVVLCLLQVGADVDRYDPLCPQSAFKRHGSCFGDRAACFLCATSSWHHGVRWRRSYLQLRLAWRADQTCL